MGILESLFRKYLDLRISSRVKVSVPVARAKNPDTPRADQPEQRWINLALGRTQLENQVNTAMQTLPMTQAFPYFVP